MLGIAAVGALLFDMLLLSRGLLVSFRELLDAAGFDVRVTAGELPDTVPDAWPAADQVVAARQELDILRQAVGDLPDKCRTVFVLYRGRGLTMRQIAERLGISEKTVEKHIAKAMLHCRGRLRLAGRRV